MILHMIRALAKHGVDTIIISLHYLGDQIRKVLNKEAVILKIKIIFVVEEKPLGTAGALRQAKAELESVGDGPFFMLNADIIAEYPFAELAKIHHESKGEHKWKGTIVATKVADPSKFGVIIRDDDGRIRGFVEKPKEYISDLINAGLYILEMEVVDMIPKDAEFSIERQVFPIIASEGYLNSIELRGFWKDLGNPRDFIIGQRLYLEHLRKTGIQVHSWIKGVEIIQPVLISITATINSGSIIGPNVVIGENVRIGFSVSIRDSSVMDGAYIGSKSHIFNSIVGWKAKVGREAYLDECYLGFGTEIKSKEVCRGRSVE